MIQDKIRCLRDHIASICAKTGRHPHDIILVGITKYADAASVKEAVLAGLEHIGENKVQQAQEKFPILAEIDKSVTRHMVGHLQTNKVKQALGLFDMIQSVDSIKLATEIEKQAEKLNKTIDVLLQVNVATEEQKFGVSPNDVFPLIDSMAGFKYVKLKGLMTIAPFTEESQAVHSCFRELRELRDKVQERYSSEGKIKMDILSMGMTNDYEIAIEEGANMIRIGRAIFE